VVSGELAKALAAFQAELPKIGKANQATVEGKEGRRGYTYKYADLADVIAAVMPLLGKNGLAFTSRPTLTDKGVFVLAYDLLHSSGESLSGIYPLPASNVEPQRLGSAISYARRYCLLAVTGVAPDEDDDGASAPAASSRPAERHESTWDAAEQEMLRDGYEADIAKAKTADDLTAIGRGIRTQRANGELSPATYDRLVRAGAARKAELNGGGAHGDSSPGQPETVSEVPQEADARDRAGRRG
jgi:hypothetical protein